MKSEIGETELNTLFPFRNPKSAGELNRGWMRPIRDVKQIQIAGTLSHIMNLRLAHKLIAKAEHQPHGFLKVRGREEAREVHLMAEAGLVKATESDKSDPPEAMITRITHAGHQFYRALYNVRSFSHS